MKRRSLHTGNRGYARVIFRILLGLAALGLLYGLGSWGWREYTLRPLTGRLTVSDPGLMGDINVYQAGAFDIILFTNGETAATRGARLVVISNTDPARRWLWHTRRGEAFIAAAEGQEQVEEARGTYFISDRLSRTCTDQVLETIFNRGDTVVVRGSLKCGGEQNPGYTLTFRPASDNQLSFELRFDDERINRAYLTYASDSDERFFGFGEQFSHFDHKGQRVPIWVSEQGIGRGQQPLTFLVDRVARSGGTPYSTYAAVPHYMTSRLRSLFLENSEYTVFDLRRSEQVQISVFAPHLAGRILYGDTPESLIVEYTSWAGRMRPLPDWILEGAVVGMQGGTEKVRQVYEQLKARDVPVTAFWLQDWVGQRTTSFGKQLWWNWELDTDRYPGWEILREDLRADDVRVMLYASPFLADVAALKPNLRRNLFREAEQAGYLVRQLDGSAYLIQNTDFSAGLLDLTNPAAVDWYKSVLEQELIAVGASGWMADFGEALPYDAVLADGTPAAAYHNRYPQEWARLNRELVDSRPDGDELVFFTRAAFQRSPAYTTLMWEGDQLVSWDEHDGIKSAVTGLLSGGMSGFSLNHSDIGGYTGINNPLARYTRSKELLMRWMEFSALTTVFRTHEGNLPDQNVQFYADDETLAHFAQMAKLYTAWEPIRKELVREAAQTGMPVARHLFLHYPQDRRVYDLSYQQYLLGPDLLVAPVLDPGKNEVRVYLPAGNWVHVWSGQAYRSPFDSQWVTVPAPMGQPGLFYKENTETGRDLIEGLQEAGLLSE